MTGPAPQGASALRLLALAFLVSVLVPLGSAPASSAEPAQKGKFCHAITDGKGNRCHSGATEFCEAVPIVATNSAQARDACNACMGGSDCYESSTDKGGNAWWGSAGDMKTGFEISSFQFAKDAFEGGTKTAGTISDSSKAVGRWGPLSEAAAPDRRQTVTRL